MDSAAAQGLILIVDDEEVLRELLTEEVRNLGYRALAASNGVEALQVLELRRPQAILSDIRMPQMDGMALLQEVRRRKWDIPFVFLSGFADKETALTALKHGAFDLLEKPLQIKVLREVLHRAVTLGFALESVDAELDQLCDEADVAPNEREEFRRVKRVLIRQRKVHQLIFKKDG